MSSGKTIVRSVSDSEMRQRGAVAARQLPSLVPPSKKKEEYRSLHLTVQPVTSSSLAPKKSSRNLFLALFRRRYQNPSLPTAVSANLITVPERPQRIQRTQSASPECQALSITSKTLISSSSAEDEPFQSLTSSSQIISSAIQIEETPLHYLDSSPANWEMLLIQSGADLTSTFGTQVSHGAEGNEAE